jgi:D-glycero-D-manno-heptose 1,7-bisphosphate phosphatase
MSLKRPAIFFDRDNTLIVSDGYLSDPNKVVLVEGAAEAVAKARQLGYQVVVFSNQSGVAKGMFGEEAVWAVNTRLNELLKAAKSTATIALHEYCPYHPEAKVEKYKLDSPLRKPKPGMILAAADKLKLDLGRSWVIGDAPRDIEAGRAAGCRTILYKNSALAPSPAALEPSKVEPDFVASSLAEAMEIVGREVFRTKVEGSPRAHAVVSSLATAIGGATETMTAATGPSGLGEAAMKLMESGKMDDTTEATGSADSAADSSTAASRPEDVIPSAARGDTLAPQSGRDNATSPRSEELLHAILVELRRQREGPSSEFSVNQLLAVITQVLALGLMTMAIIFRTEEVSGSYLMFAIMLQVLTIALLMWRGRAQ